MRLELNIINISDVRFADKTAVANGILYINHAELQALVKEDNRLTEVEIELAHPGEKCRILQVLDVIEPRAKISHLGGHLPGMVSKHSPCGQGSTAVLSDSAVVISDYRENIDLTTSRDPNGEIIDMSGPGAELGLYGKTHNVVLLCTPKNGINSHDYHAALKIAALKTAQYLAEAGEGVPPDRKEIYELPSLTDVAKGMDNLPKVVYIFQILTLQFEPIQGDPVLYGKNVGDIVPTILHPNEIIDGAITSPLPSLNVQTYQIQNHAIIKELYKRHGKELCFVGVIVTTAPNNVTDIKRVSMMAANLAKHVVGADGTVLTKTGGGAPELTLATTAQYCEQMGIKTAIAMLHMGADISDARFGATTIFNMPEVDAIVSMGGPFMELTLPAVDGIIGRPGPSSQEPPINGELRRAIRWVKGSQCQLGSSKLTALRY
ncbi:glycine/sarcosine/betaine reductase component B subunit [Chloroflexota bacterium]